LGVGYAHSKAPWLRTNSGPGWCGAESRAR
jgi:hypothetical protein